MCSVDPPGCTDIDDALHCRELDNGNLEVSKMGTVKNICFISFLYLNLYVPGDDTLIIYGSFMRTKHLFVQIHTRNKGEAGTIKYV